MMKIKEFMEGDEMVLEFPPTLSFEDRKDVHLLCARFRKFLRDKSRNVGEGQRMLMLTKMNPAIKEKQKILDQYFNTPKPDSFYRRVLSQRNFSRSSSKKKERKKNGLKSVTVK